MMMEIAAIISSASNAILEIPRRPVVTGRRTAILIIATTLTMTQVVSAVVLVEEEVVVEEEVAVVVVVGEALATRELIGIPEMRFLWACAREIATVRPNPTMIAQQCSVFVAVYLF